MSTTDPDSVRAVATERENHMSGEADKASGRLKQAAGDLTGNDELKREGEKDEAAGKVKDAVGDAKDKINQGVDSIKEKLS